MTPTTLAPSDRATDAAVTWAGSGAMSLTGRPDGPHPGPPAGLVERCRAVGEHIRRVSGRLGSEVVLDVGPLLGERAALAGLTRQGDVSCGGATRLLRSRDGWVAVTLARDDDRQALAAWLERVVDPEDPWPDLAPLVARRFNAELVARAALLALPVSALPPRSQHRSALPAPNLSRDGARSGHRSTAGSLSEVTVLDLSSLWAGPLCGQILMLAGARVTKVESTSRPDGARSGPAAFFDLMNAGKRSVAIDLRTDDGRRQLKRLVAEADVIIESSRPRALEQLGIHAATEVAAVDGPSVWVSITGYGRDGPDRNRVAFGDDAAVAGGLVAWDDIGPCFCADAIADPLSGLIAAAACLDSLWAGDRRVLDVAMRDVAAAFAGPTLAVPTGTDSAPPRARAVPGRGPALGQHNDELLR